MLRIVLGDLYLSWPPPVVDRMGNRRRNPAVLRIRSWAEEVRGEEVSRALRRLQTLSAKDRKARESLSRRIVNGLLSPPPTFASQTSEALPRSERLPLVCGMFELRGQGCDLSRCVAEAGFLPPEASCGTAKTRVDWDGETT